MRAWWLVVMVLVACGTRETTRREPPTPEPVPQPIVLPPPPPTPFEVPAPTDKIVSLGRGARHACVVRESGAVDCWGQNELKQCDEEGGDCVSPPLANHAIRRVPDITDAIAIGTDAKCIARRGADVSCIATDKLAFAPVAGMGVASLVDNDCAVVGTSVRCVDDDKPVEVANLPDVVQLRASTVLGCALRKTGEVWCGGRRSKWARIRGLDRVESIAVVGSWGVNLCVANKTSARCYEFDFAKLIVTEPSEIKDLVGARDLSMRSETTTRFEGQYFVSGIVGGKVVEIDPRQNPEIRKAHTVPVLEDAKQLVGGCALRAQGSVVCWGNNEGGALSQPTTLGSEHMAPTKVVGLTDIADIAIGTTEVYALTRAGQVFHWGRLGANRWQISARPQELPLGAGPELLVQIDALANGQLCMRTANGLVWCQDDRVRAIVQLDTSDVQRIVASGASVFLIRANGYVEHHGIDYRTGYFSKLLHATNVVDVAAAHETRCVLGRNGDVRCREQIPDLKGVSRIVMTNDTICGLRGGHVVCNVDKKGLVEVPGIVDATDLATSREYACAVHGGGRVSCWHVSTKGDIGKVEDVIAAGATRVKLGDGTKDQLAESSGLHGPPPGGELGCAIMNDRTMQCWGTNIMGEIGDGSVIESATPIGVPL